MEEPQQEIEEPKEENTIEKPKSGRSNRSEKQKAAFEKAQAKRIENARLKKEAKKNPPPPPSESESESEPEPEIRKKKKQKPKKKKIIYESPSESESSDSELDEYTITRKKRAPKSKEPPPVERQFAGLRFV